MPNLIRNPYGCYHQRKLSREEALLEVAIIKGDGGTLEAFGWKKADMDDEEFEAWKAKEGVASFGLGEVRPIVLLGNQIVGCSVEASSSLLHSTNAFA